MIRNGRKSSLKANESAADFFGPANNDTYDSRGEICTRLEKVKGSLISNKIPT